MRYATAVFAPALVWVASAQLAGTKTQERHPQLSVQSCTKSGGCQTQQRAVTVDANWRWTNKDGTNCYTGNAWDTSLCPDPKTCAENCAIEGADTEYTSTYGVKAQGNSLELQFVTQGPYSKNIGSRNYLMEDESQYQLFKLKNKEFTFDVDVSNLPCGLNGAVYFVQMDADGGMGKYAGNKAGAKYGTGYCDAQCPHDLKWINGEANVIGWKPSANDANAGTGKYGTCCTEMDIWEANSISTAYTPHACSVDGQTRCEGIDCGDGNPNMGPVPGHRFDGVCDKNGCDLQTYRFGNKDFFGPGKQVDTKQKMTVVTQFVTADGTDTGALTEIRRFYVQDGKAIPTPKVDVGGKQFDSISDAYCTAEVDKFQDNTNFLQKGGLGAMDKAMEKGMVLVLSLWDDHDANMLWLDSTYPTNGTCESGACRGTCPTSSGVPKDIEASIPGSSYSVTNIKYGDIGSTTSVSPGPSPPAPPAPGPQPPSPGPSPSGCPGGSLSACMDLCPSSPAVAYKACVDNCVKRC